MQGSVSQHFDLGSTRGVWRGSGTHWSHLEQISGVARRCGEIWNSLVAPRNKMRPHRFS